MSISVIVYMIYYYIFRDAHHIFIYLVGDIAFVFVEALPVVLILYRLLGYREKIAMLNKLNMVIGASYSEAGIGLLKGLSVADKNFKSISSGLIPSAEWIAKKFQAAHRKIREYEYSADEKLLSLVQLKEFLSAKRDFLLRLLENPNLLEQESFTNLLLGGFFILPKN